MQRIRVRRLVSRRTPDACIAGVANLQAIAGQLHLQLPSKPNNTQEQQISELSKLHGPQFDAQFERITLTDEQKFLRSFQSGASAARNPAVKSAISDMIPVVQEHIEIVRAIPGQYPHRTAEAAQRTVR